MFFTYFTFTWYLLTRISLRIPFRPGNLKVECKVFLQNYCTEFFRLQYFKSILQDHSLKKYQGELKSNRLNFSHGHSTE